MKRFLVLFSILFTLVTGAWGANDVTHVPFRTDTFGSDVAYKHGKFMLKRMVITAYTSAKTITFINDLGDKVLVLECPSGETIDWPPTDSPVSFPDGFIFDDSASDLASGDFIFIWRE